MKKVIFETEKQETVNFADIKNSDIVGFVDNAGYKGFVSHVGGSTLTGEFKAISVEDGHRGTPNVSYGPNFAYSSVRDALELKDCVRLVREAYVSPDMKQLLKWLSED